MNKIKFLLIVLFFVNNIIIAQNCNKELFCAPDMEIWYNPKKENIIDGWSDENNKSYVKMSRIWSTQGPPAPKKFDVKITVINVPILDSFPDIPPPISNWYMDVKMDVLVSQNINGNVPLNPKISETISLLNKKKISNSDFSNREHPYHDIWIKDIDYESIYKKYFRYIEKPQFVNQLIFNVILEDEKKENYCLFQYKVVVSVN